MLELLADDRKDIVVAGDLAQSMRLGASYHVPNLQDGKGWRRHRLTGSYRLPLRICECVRPLVDHIDSKHRSTREAEYHKDGISLPEPKKAAELGGRPIVVSGDSTNALATNIYNVVHTCRSGIIDTLVTIVEKDRKLERALCERLCRGFKVECESMHRIKGLERPCVIWSTREPICEEEVVEEWVYTILTRTTGILIIAVGGETQEQFKQAIGLLRHDRLLYWSQSARKMVESYRIGMETE
jgi:hypothetical protein